MKNLAAFPNILKAKYLQYVRKVPEKSLCHFPERFRSVLKFVHLFSLLLFFKIIIYFQLKLFGGGLIPKIESHIRLDFPRIKLKFSKDCCFGMEGG